MSRPDDFEFGIWIKFFFIIVIGLGGAVILFFVLNTYMSSLTQAKTGSATLLFEPNTVSVKKGEQVTSQLILNTNLSNIHGVELVLKYDPAKLTLIRVKPVAQELTTLKTFLPYYGYYVFNDSLVIREGNTTGEIRISAITADMKQKMLTAPFSGLASLVELSFVARDTGKSEISIVTGHPSKDSAVVQNVGRPINILTKTNILSVEIKP